MRVNANGREPGIGDDNDIQSNEYFNEDNSLISNAESLPLQGSPNDKYPVQSCEVNGTFYYVREIYNMCGQIFSDYLKTNASNEEMSYEHPEVLFNQKCTPPDLFGVYKTCNFTNLKNKECTQESKKPISSENKKSHPTLDELKEVWIETFCTNNWTTWDITLVVAAGAGCLILGFIIGYITYVCKNKNHQNASYNETPQEDIEMESGNYENYDNAQVSPSSASNVNSSSPLPLYSSQPLNIKPTLTTFTSSNLSGENLHTIQD